MVTAEQLDTRRASLGEWPELEQGVRRLVARVQRTLEAGLEIPSHKAMLSVDGGVCPDDGSPLIFDPWKPAEHRCPRCGRMQAGVRYDRYAARYQHLWLAERGAEAAAVGVLTGEESLIEWAHSLLAGYAERYRDYPNRDNVLGPSRLFFSTYLESIWLNHYLSAASLLREAGALDASVEEGVSGVADEAANLIGEFDEGLSNRQTWHLAALAAVAVWFEDEELLRRAVEGGRGLVGHLASGFGSDGLWFEGENYHLFALQGLLKGMGWAQLAGVDLLESPDSVAQLTRALLAPAMTALPDGCFPARRDARFGVSLAQPMYLELWEIGRARLLRAGQGDSAAKVDSWLQALYRLPAPAAQTLDSYLHEAGEPTPRKRDQSALSWWTLLEMEPSAGDTTAPWQPASVLFAEQGLAILRSGDRYVSLECGPSIGGHGHPDRLSLTLHANEVHWLPDPGTGSYVSGDLFWYRSSLAHNVPRLDGVDQPSDDARCEAFESRGEWGWVSGRFGELRRTIVTGPRYLLDVTEFASESEHQVELPWHFPGTIAVESSGRWEPGELESEFVTGVERFVPGANEVLRVRVEVKEHRLTMHALAEGELLRAQGPGLPGTTEPAAFLLQRARGRYLRFVAVLEPGGETTVTGVRLDGDGITVATTNGDQVHRATPEGWEVYAESGRVALRGRRRIPAEEPVLDLRIAELTRPSAAHAIAPHVAQCPRLDGTTAGFIDSAPLTLDYDDQYRRSEEPYPGPDQLSARALVNWDEEALYIAVEVTKPDPWFRSAEAEALRLDNELDEIHSDGLQLYFDTGELVGVLVVPDPNSNTVRVRPLAGSASVLGAWRRTAYGYCVTLAITLPGWAPPGTIGFDLVVNEMHNGRERRTGQLVWSGGGGWVYLRGAGQDPTRFGVLELE